MWHPPGRKGFVFLFALIRTGNWSPAGGVTAPCAVVSPRGASLCPTGAWLWGQSPWSCSWGAPGSAQPGVSCSSQKPQNSCRDGVKHGSEFGEGAPEKHQTNSVGAAQSREILPEHLGLCTLLTLPKCTWGCSVSLLIGK